MGTTELEILQTILKGSADLESKGLDTSSLKTFIESYKQFIKENDVQSTSNLAPNVKLDAIRRILNNRGVFPTNKDIIDHAKLYLEFEVENKKNRKLIIEEVLMKMNNTRAIEMFNESILSLKQSSTKKTVTTEPVYAETLKKWFEVIENI